MCLTVNSIYNLIHVTGPNLKMNKHKLGDIMMILHVYIP